VRDRESVSQWDESVMFGSSQELGFEGGYELPVSEESGTPEKRTKPVDIQTCLPVTVRLLSDAASNMVDGNDELQIHGVQVANITLVGIVESLVEQASGLEFTLNDASGRIKVRHYQHGDAAADMQGIEVGRYVSLVGGLRVTPMLHVSTLSLRPIESADEVSYHMIEVGHAALTLLRGGSRAPDPPTPEKLTKPVGPAADPVTPTKEATPQMIAADGKDPQVPAKTKEEIIAENRAKALERKVALDAAKETALAKPSSDKDIGAQNPDLSQRKADLLSMKRRELEQLARASGLTERDIEAADDSDNPKEAFVRLLLAAGCAKPRALGMDAACMQSSNSGTPVSKVVEVAISEDSAAAPNTVAACKDSTAQPIKSDHQAAKVATTDEAHSGSTPHTTKSILQDARVDGATSSVADIEAPKHRQDTIPDEASAQFDLKNSGLDADVLAVLPADAPAGHAAFEKIQKVSFDSSGHALVTFTRPDMRGHFQVTQRSTANNLYAAFRIARACYVKFEEGLHKSVVLAFRNEYCQLLTQRLKEVAKRTIAKVLDVGMCVQVKRRLPGSNAIREGECGVVQEIDHDGDALIQFQGIADWRCVLKSEFSFLEVQAPETDEWYLSILQKMSEMPESAKRDSVTQSRSRRGAPKAKSSTRTVSAKSSSDVKEEDPEAQVKSKQRLRMHKPDVIVMATSNESQASEGQENAMQESDVQAEEKQQEESDESSATSSSSSDEGEKQESIESKGQVVVAGAFVRARRTMVLPGGIELEKGMCGVVSEIDDDGDAFIKFYGIADRKCVLADELNALDVLEAEEAAIVAAKAQLLPESPQKPQAAAHESPQKPRAADSPMGADVGDAAKRPAQVSDTPQSDKRRRLEDDFEDDMVVDEAEKNLIEGSWDKGTVEGNKLLWLEGVVTELTSQTGRSLKMTHLGVEYSAELKPDGKLHWSDGDTWERKAAVRGPGSEIPDACRFKLVEKLHLGLHLQLGAVYTACDLRHRCGGSRSTLDRLNQLLKDGIKLVPEAVCTTPNIPASGAEGSSQCSIAEETRPITEQTPGIAPDSVAPAQNNTSAHEVCREAEEKVSRDMGDDPTGRWSYARTNGKRSSYRIVREDGDLIYYQASFGGVLQKRDEWWVTDVVDASHKVIGHMKLKLLGENMLSNYAKAGDDKQWDDKEWSPDTIAQREEKEDSKMTEVVEEEKKEKKAKKKGKRQKKYGVNWESMEEEEDRAKKKKKKSKKNKKGKALELDAGMGVRVRKKLQGDDYVLQKGVHSVLVTIG
jgi:hypothetical protein